MKFRSLLLALTFASLFAACGSDTTSTPQETPEPRFENPKMEQCFGCVDDDDDCQDGNDDNACGSGGDACEVCGDGDVCGPDGNCEPPPSCDASCDGCCDSDGVCQDGDSNAACGENGNACASCAGMVCDAGQCVMDTPACGPDNCNGCCDDMGMCVGGNDNIACGLAGAVCTDCTATGEACGTGVCGVNPNSCAATCNGCCDGELCVSAPDATQCGAAGNMCIACGPDESCVNGTCGVVPPTGIYDVFVVSATSQQFKDNGADWDFLDIYPNLFVRVGAVEVGETDVWIEDTSNTDDFQVTYNEMLPLGAPTSAINNLFQIELWDQDTASADDLICIINPPIDATVLSGVEQTSVCSTNAASTVTWRLVER